MAGRHRPRRPPGRPGPHPRPRARGRRRRHRHRPGIDPAATAAAVALAVLVTLVKAIAGITVSTRAPGWQQALERAGAAAAGAAAALLPADGLGLLTLDWGDLGLAAAGAAALALAAMVTNPPQPHPGVQLPPYP